MVQSTSNRLIYLLLFPLFTITILVLIHLLFYNYRITHKFNMPNFIMFLLSLVIVVIFLLNMKKRGLNSYNIYFVTYFIFLFMNTFSISDLQYARTYKDIYYFIIGPIIFGIILMVFENMTHKRVISTNFLPKVNINILAVLLFLVYLLVSVRIYQTVGFKLFSDQLLRYQKNNDYVVPGLSGIQAIIIWTLVMLIPHIKKKLSVPILLIIVTVSGILQFSRGNIFRILLFLLVLFIFYKGKKFLTKKIVIPFVMVLFMFSLLFSAIGEYRQNDPSSTFNIGSSLRSISENNTINWIYGYTAINFDVLKLYIEKEPTYYPTTILLPFERVFGDGSKVILYSEEKSASDLNGFNASTFLSGFIMDYGMLYIFELIIFGIIVGVMIYTVKILNYKGIYIFLVTYITLFFYGNYLIIPNYFYSVILAFVILIFSNTNEKEHLNN